MEYDHLQNCKYVNIVHNMYCNYDLLLVVNVSIIFIEKLKSLKL